MQQHTGQHVLSAAIDQAVWPSRTRELSSRRRRCRRSIVARELSRVEIAAAETEANRDRLGGSAGGDSVRRRRRGRARFRCERVAARRHAAADRHRDRSTCRRAAARMSRAPAASASSRSRGGSGSRAANGSNSCAAAARCSGFERPATPSRSSVRLLSVLPDGCRPPSERMQAEAKDQKRAFAGAPGRAGAVSGREARGVGRSRSEPRPRRPAGDRCRRERTQVAGSRRRRQNPVASSCWCRRRRRRSSSPRDPADVTQRSRSRSLVGADRAVRWARRRPARARSGRRVWMTAGDPRRGAHRRTRATPITSW